MNNQRNQPDPDAPMLDERLAEIDRLAGEALRSEQRKGLEARLFDASRAALASAPPLQLVRSADDAEGPCALPGRGRSFIPLFAAMAALVLLAIGLTLRFGVQLLHNAPPGHGSVAAGNTADELFFDDELAIEAELLWEELATLHRDDALPFDEWDVESAVLAYEVSTLLFTTDPESFW